MESVASPSAARFTGPASASATEIVTTAPRRGFSFGDLIDAINPLHHIPVVGAIYRAITGDTIRAEARLVGGGLFGGAIGLAAAAADTVVESETGKDVGQHTMGLFRGRDDTRLAALPEAATDHVVTPPAGLRTKAHAIPELTPQQLDVLARSFGEDIALQLKTRTRDRDENTAPTAPEDDAGGSAVSGLERQVAYGEAMRRMAEALDRYQGVDRGVP